jgi:hypothetical protein
VLEVGLGGRVILHPPILPSSHPPIPILFPSSLMSVSGQVVLVPTDEQLGRESVRCQGR